TPGQPARPEQSQEHRRPDDQHQAEVSEVPRAAEQYRHGGVGTRPTGTPARRVRRRRADGERDATGDRVTVRRDRPVADQIGATLGARRHRDAQPHALRGGLAAVDRLSVRAEDVDLSGHDAYRFAEGEDGLGRRLREHGSRLWLGRKQRGVGAGRSRWRHESHQQPEDQPRQRGDHTTTCHVPHRSRPSYPGSRRPSRLIATTSRKLWPQAPAEATTSRKLWRSWRRYSGPMTDRLSPGDQAPDFTLPTADGGQLSLSDLRGRKVILYAYPAAMT